MVKLLLYLLLFFLPIQLGKHFWFDFSYKLGQRIDYLSPTIYFTDILIGLILIAYFFTSEVEVSRNFARQFLHRRFVPPSEEFRQRRTTSEEGLRFGYSPRCSPGSLFSPRRWKLFPCSIASLLVLSISYWLLVIRQNSFLLIYNLARLLEFILLGIVIAKTFKKEDFPKIISVLNLALVLQVSLAAYQVLSGKTLGLWLLGERTFSISTPGIARFVAPTDHQLLRAYGTFPHPNVFGGFCLLLLVANSFLFLGKRRNYLKLSTPEVEASRDKKDVIWSKSFLNSLVRLCFFHLWGGNSLLIYLLGFTLSLLGIWLSFSAVAIILSQIFLLSLVIIFFFCSPGQERLLGTSLGNSSSLASSHHPRSLRHLAGPPRRRDFALLSQSGSLVRWLALLAFPLLIILITNYYLPVRQAGLLQPKAGPPLAEITFKDDSFSRRLTLLEISWDMFRQSPIFGVGFGNFIPSMPARPIGRTYFWQPVHNIFALVVTETGLVGLVVVCLLIWKGIRKIKNQKSKIKNTYKKLKIPKKSNILITPAQGWSAFGGNYQLLIVLSWWLIVLLTGLFDHYWLTLQQGRLMLTLLLGLSFVNK